MNRRQPSGSRWVRAVVALAVGALAVASPVARASAAPLDQEAAAAPTAAASGGWVRFGHFAPSAAPVDVYVDGRLLAAAISFKTVSEYVPVAAGPHRFELKPGGQPQADSLLVVEAGVPEGGAVTVAALTTRSGIASQVYDDALVMPAPGQALVRFIHAAPEVPGVDLQVASGGTVLVEDLAYPSATGYQPITPGEYDIEVRAAGGPEVLLRIDAWSIRPGTQASVVLVRGAGGGLDVAPVVDAAATAITPVGGVQTGYGGMAPRAPEGAGASWMFAAAALVLAFVPFVPLLTLQACRVSGRRRRVADRA